VWIHILVLMPLVFVRTGSAPAEAVAASVSPIARVQAPRPRLSESTILPKPRVVPPPAASGIAAVPLLERPSAATAEQQTVEALKPIISPSKPGRPSASAKNQARYVVPQVEFFGSRLDQRKVCFVVDASGSMLGLFTAVRSHLAASIERLQADQYFNIIFFNDRLTEYSPGVLTRATPSARAAALAFIEKAKVSGPTNPLAALEKAMRCRDASGDAPGLICFLTDGFDLSPGKAGDLPAAVESLRKQFAPAARINTIGFWTQPHDCATLQKMAAASGGEFVNINR
jgi:hypothetical protein